MELYLLTNDFKRESVIDAYDSLIWTERFNEIGEFELLITPQYVTNRLSNEGAYLGLSESNRVMVIQTIEMATDEEGAEKLKITGPSLEYVFRDRPNQNYAMPMTTAFSPLVLSGVPADTLATHVINLCVDNKNNSSGLIVPYLQPGSITPPDSILPPADSVTIQREVESLYDTIRAVCTTYNLGFRLIRNKDTSMLYFEVYTGSDRTSRQSSRTAVIFSKGMDNLSEVTELRSIAGVKNVAYVFAKNGADVVYSSTTPTDVAGYDKKMLMVKADDLDQAVGPELTAAIRQRGLEELAKYNSVFGFDGKINYNSGYKYGVDYNLGDMVEQRSETGLAADLRVVEQIFVSDKEGKRAYPTLLADLYVTPGSWFAWYPGQVWDNAIGFWEDARAQGGEE